MTNGGFAMRKFAAVLIGGLMLAGIGAWVADAQTPKSEAAANKLNERAAQPVPSVLARVASWVLRRHGEVAVTSSGTRSSRSSPSSG